MKTLLSVLILVIATASYSQTKGWKQLPGPYFGFIREVQIAPDNTIYALQSNGYISRLLSGKYWEKFLSPSGVVASSDQN